MKRRFISPLSCWHSVKERKGAFSLVEVTIALGVASFCFLVILGLIPAGLNNNRNSIQQTAAAGLATDLVSDLRASSGTVSAQYSLNLLGTTTTYLNEDGSISASPSGKDPVYRATITVTPPSANTRTASIAWVRITWPANVDPAAQKPSGTYETVVGLDRN